MMRPAVLTLLLLTASIAPAADPAPSGDDFFEEGKCGRCWSSAASSATTTRRPRAASKSPRATACSRAATAAPPSRPASRTTASSSGRLPLRRQSRRCRRPASSTSADIQVLTRWVELGAPWPQATVLAAPAAEFRITDEQRRFWSFQPVKATGPAGRGRTPRGTAAPIDRFVQAEARGPGSSSVTPVGPGRQTRPRPPGHVRPDGAAADAGGG